MVSTASGESSCVFCRIARGEVEADRILDDENLVAFRDLNPQAPVHALVIPKRHVTSVAALEEGDEGLMGTLILGAKRVAEQEGLTEDGYRIVTNHGADGGQTVYHLHVHVLGGRRMTWPPG